MAENNIDVEKFFEEYGTVFEAIASDEELGIMLALTGAGVLYDEWGITSHHELKRTIRLNEEGKTIYDKMIKDGLVDYSKLDNSHYEIIETKERFNEIVGSEQ
jgi:hypothetical protein